MSASMLHLVDIPCLWQDYPKPMSSCSRPEPGFFFDLAWTEGCWPSKTQSLWCFQIIQGVRRATEPRPLRSSLGVFYFARSHQSTSALSWLGTGVVIRSQASTSCQVCRAKGHSRRRCRMVSGAWSQRRQRGWCCRPRRASLLAVQHRSWLASQWKNLIRCGAQFFQISFQEEHAVEP